LLVSLQSFNLQMKQENLQDIMQMGNDLIEKKIETINTYLKNELNLSVFATTEIRGIKV
jgi:hypothetical protein